MFMGSPRLILASLIIVTGFTVAILSLWAFEWRWLGAFDESANVPSSTTLVHFENLNALKRKSGRITVRQYINPSCPCNRYVNKHRRELELEFSGNRVAFEEVNPRDLVGVKPSATPAIAIWDEAGNLAYYGAFSNGVLCNAKTSLIGPVISSLLEGTNPLVLNTNGVGCFCSNVT